MATREVAPLPMRTAAPSLKLPILPPFDTPESIVLALSSRELPILTAALLQIEKRGLAIIALESPRAVKDPLLDYLAKYPTADGVFAAWDTAHKSNNSQLSAAVLQALGALIRLISTDAGASEPEVIRRLLTQYGTHLDRALNPGRNDVTVAALRLLNVVVGFGSGRFARRMFSSMQWQPKIVTRLFRTRLKDTSRDPLSRPDIRTLLTMLILALLSAGDARLKGDVIETKGLISGVVKGLAEDSEVVINHVLVTLFTDIAQDRAVALETRRAVFDESCITELIKLYDVPSDDDSATSARSSVHRFFFALTEWLATQINDSSTRSYGPQKVLGTILRTLKVTEDGEQRELGLHILSRAPVLAGAFWARFPASLDPRLSSRWISAVTFASQVVSLPVSPFLSVASNSLAAPPAVSSVLENILPPTLNKTWYSKALQHESPLVSFLASIFLLASLQKAARVLEAIADSSTRLEEGKGGRWAGLGVRLREHLRTILPDPQIVVALMQKTAAVILTPAAVKSSKSKKVVDPKKLEAKAIAAKLEAEADQLAGRHLRTNVALRMLWLYHRVSPALIATLRFDFARLPQAHVARNDAEGIRAISSAYALRLAAVHSTTLIWSRPGDHYKNTLLPLFQLYRTPSTPSNRHLLLAILGRLLTTPILFGETSSNVDDEVSIWLSALPTPVQNPTNDGSNVLDFFEKVVQKTLTAPMKMSVDSTTEDTASTRFSPLLSNVIQSLKGELKDRSEGMESLMEFVRKMMLGFIGQAREVDLIVGLAKEVGEVLKGVKGTEATRKLVESYVAALTVGTEVGAEEFTGALEDGLIETWLHVRPSDLASPTTSLALLDLIASKKSWIPSLQILLHRYLSITTLTLDDRSAFVEFFTAALKRCDDDKTRLRIQVLLVGIDGALKVFSQGTDKGLLESSAMLIAAILDSDVPQDRLLALPFCQIVVADLKTNKKSKKISPIPERVLLSSPLLRFFDDSDALLFLSTLLYRIPTTESAVAQLDDLTKSILSATLSRAETLPFSAEFQSLWTTHFITLLRFTTRAEIESAGAILSKCAEALLPFDLSSSSSTPTSSSAHRSTSSEWLVHAAEWTAELLSPNEKLNSNRSSVLATFIYRSPTTRTTFVNWLMEQKTIDGGESALRALLEVEGVKSTGVVVAESIALDLAHRLLSSDSASVDIGRSLELICKSSSETASKISEYFSAEIATLERDSYTASMLSGLSNLVSVDGVFRNALEDYVNGSFNWLVRRFVEVPVDSEIVLEFVEMLRSVCTKHEGWKHKTHLLDPLITAAIVHRLDKAEPIKLAAALCSGHSWKDNEVTRLLSNVFAHDEFKARLLNSDVSRNTQSAIVALVVALARSSILAAASTRVVEKLMPFYGGTLSFDDKSILDLFHRIEIIIGNPLSVAFRKFNPSLDPQSPPESTRAATLAALEVSYVKRSWLRACASTRTVFPTEHERITYDPEFLLGLLSQTIVEEELKISDWLAFLETGILGLAIAALGSSSIGLRRLAQATLADTLVKVQTLTFREKDEIALILSHARNCVYSQQGEAVPAIIALFLANCMFLLGTPESTMYPSFSRFLLQRSLLDQRDVPMFYNLFYTTSEEPLEDQRWLLKFLADGLVRSQDWKIFRRRQTYELLASLMQSNKQDAVTRKLVLQFLIRATSIPQAAQELLSRNGLLGWIAAQVPADASERRLMINVIGNIVEVVDGEKMGTISDLLDTLTGCCRLADVVPTEITSICKIVAKISANLSVSASSHSIILDRTRDLLSFVAPFVLSNPSSQYDFYSAVMSATFARSLAGVEESTKDKELFSLAIAAGLRAGVEEVRVETLRCLCG